MREQITTNWWVMTLRGLLSVLLGLVAFAAPGAALTLLVSFFGAYALVDGVFALMAAVRWGRTDDRWWLLLLEGIVGIGVGIYVFAHSATTALALITVVGIWAVITGVIEIAAAIRLRRVITGEWLLGVCGALSVLFGIALLAAPGVGILVWMTVLGVYALMYGGSLLALAFRLRGHSQSADSRSAAI